MEDIMVINPKRNLSELAMFLYNQIFEMRRCENCKHINKIHCSYWLLDVVVSNMTCSKFEEKEE